jgi:DNA-binding PadR family transcriptional regulator
MARLEAAKLVASTAHATGARKSRRYRVTPSGRRALVSWVGPPLPAEVVGVPPDPLRMRVACMSVLPETGRRALLEAMETLVREHLLQSKRALREGVLGGGDFDLMARGAIAMQNARLAWLRRVRRTVSGPRQR